MVQPRSLPDILRRRYEAPKLVNNLCVQQMTWALIALSTACTRHAFRWEMPDVHDSQDPFSLRA
jgi:hypothetical protein